MSDGYAGVTRDVRVERYTPALQALLEEAERLGVYAIGRVQDVRERGFVASNGNLERQSAGQAAGLGVQVFSAEGLCGFAASDRIGPAEARELVRRAAELARASAPLDPERNRAVFALSPEPTRVWPRTGAEIDATPMGEQSRVLLEVHREARDLAQGFSTRSGHAVVDEEWRIVRSDGTDVSFAMPRAHVRHEFTARSDDGAASGGCAVSGADARVLLDEEYAARLRLRAVRAIERARAVLDARPVASGSYKLVIDYALAKGLAHEAFGHAAETDGAETSILATGGRLRLGEAVAPPTVSIVDGPIPGDFAYQPVSANGIPRRTTQIIRDGVLSSGLGDLFSAEKAGSPITGAGRAESYRVRPLPRMSNIRIVVRDPLPLDRPFDELLPEDLRAALVAAGLIAPGERVLYLSGYRGGQVNPRLGDFVFNCGAIWDFTDGVVARRPAAFSGKSLSALRAIVAGLGDLHLDAMGHCGKGGQSVPSSGGSHAFLVLERHPEVVIGGE